MGEKFYANDDKVRRLDNTICFYKGAPVYVTTRCGYGYAGEDQVYINSLSQGRDLYSKAWKLIEYTENDFDYKAFPIGYVNISDKAYYLYRNPAQQYSYGLTRQSVSSSDGNFHHTYMYTDDFEKSLKREYPTLTEAIEKILKREAESVAFSMYLAVGLLSRSMVTLSYRGRIIGIKGFSNKFQVWKARENRIICRALDEAGVKYDIVESA